MNIHPVSEMSIHRAVSICERKQLNRILRREYHGSRASLHDRAVDD